MVVGPPHNTTLVGLISGWGFFLLFFPERFAFDTIGIYWIIAARFKLPSGICLL